MTVTMDVQAWAEEQFGQCDLNDKRRTRRLVNLAAEVLCHPAGSLPEQTSDMADLKAAYRFFACNDMDFEDIAGPTARHIGAAWVASGLPADSGRQVGHRDASELNLHLRATRILQLQHAMTKAGGRGSHQLDRRG